ncbi:MAG: hypothetical protein DI565_01490 [Ancylobacter novellus]|uniref:Uncharacterized protein n=1 Tax=Ancylobacter novellus TaxID=921 RepID=A0A2W5KSK2_ANCNO|nr:MAG: hypothetical protein DI565_01490 [Ancylobacter novellus]
MTFASARAAFRALLCLILLATGGPIGPAPAFAERAAVAAVQPRVAEREKDESCGRGKATTAFGWRVVEFGVTTLKYLIGLFIIPIGLFLVVVGWLLQMVEAVAC